MAKASKMTESDKQVAEVQTAQLPSTPQAAWGSEGISNSDILIPKILLMQGLSKLVSDGAANVGQIRDSLNGDLFGGKVGKEDKPVELIPFSAFRTWVVFEKQNGKDEYVGTVPITADNESWPITEVQNGIEVRRDKCLNFYVLRPEEIAEGTAFPYLISFRRYSMQAGKKLATMAAKLRVFNKPLAAKVVNLVVQAQENDKGKFFSFDLTQGRNSTEAELAAAYQWHQTLKTVTVKHDDSDLKAEAVVPTSYAEGDADLEF